MSFSTTQQFAQQVKIFAPQAFASVEVRGNVGELERETVKQLFNILSDKGVAKISGSNDNLLSSMKLAGFSGVQATEGVASGQRGEWQAAGAPLKRKKLEAPQTAANPWANLQNGAGAATINEDDLMKDATSEAIVQKFCGEDDKVMAGKPCENCTCGRKE